MVCLVKYSIVRRTKYTMAHCIFKLHHGASDVLWLTQKYTMLRSREDIEIATLKRILKAGTLGVNLKTGSVLNKWTLRMTFFVFGSDRVKQG